MPLTSQFSDDFGGTTLNAGQWNQTGTVTVGNSLVNLTTSGQGTTSGITTAGNYSMASSYFYWRPIIATSVLTDPAAGKFIAAAYYQGALVLLVTVTCQASPTITADVITNTSSGATTRIFAGNYDPTALQYLRLRCQNNQFVTGAGDVFFAYSTDASTWTENTTKATVSWGGNTSNFITVGFQFTGATSAGNRTASLDSYNMVGTYVASTNITASPDGVNDADTVTGPAASSAITTSPTGLNDSDTVTGPVAGIARVPAGINDPETVTGPSLSTALTYAPTGVADTETVGAPAGSYSFSVSPTGVNDPDALDPGNQLYGNAYNNGVYGSGVYGQTPAPYPASAGDPETVTGPTITTAYTLAPASINDAQSLAQPSIPIPDVTQPTGLGDPETVGAPTVVGPPMVVSPSAIADPEATGNPATAAAQGSMIYGGGVYGDGLYSGWATSPGTAYPDALNDSETVGVATSGGSGDPVVGTPANNGYGSGTYGTALYNTNAPTSVSPTSIGDPETLDGVGGNTPVVGTNADLGSGVYGTGVYGGPAATTPVTTTDNTIYGAGVYGAGIYYGQTATSTPDNTPAVPLFPASLSSVPLVAMHLLGIGPWSPYVVWGGVSNRGVIRSLKPAKPIIALPPATSLSITLRLVGGCEATADFSFPRGRAVIIEEMHTDLWWRRKDPYTGRLEVLGRFNAGTNDLSSDGEQVSSSVHWVDYETLLSERMLLKYKDTYTTSQVVNGKTETVQHQQTQWPLGTKVTDILRFCIPTNMGLDLSVLAADADTDLGVIRVAWSTPPDATMADIFTNVLAISSKQWEWWVQQPADVGMAPALRFVVGTRGDDNGVVLFDIGAGPSPIASWNMTAATSTYANALYFEGGSGGVVVTNAEQIDQYGQRDAHDGDSTLNGALAPIVFAADKKLNEVADRRPTFSVVLKPGFWQGRSHIDIGDDVRLYIRLGSEVLDYRYRVTELVLAIDQDGAETVTLTLGTPLSSADPRSRRSPILRVVRKLLNYAAPPHSNDQGAYDPTI